MGKGIAVQFNKHFGVKEKLTSMFDFYDDWETKPCILYNNTINLVTKERYWHKPTYDQIFFAISKMKKMVVRKEIKVLAMPRIGCGLDKLDWNAISAFVKHEFYDTDIEIIVCVQ